MKDIKKLLTKNKLVLLGLSVITLLLIIGTSFALYQIVNTQTEENLVDVGCFNVGITKQENAINLENAYPISDEKGKSLTPFTFTLTNNCNVTGKYTVNLEVLKDSTMSTSFIKTLVNNGTISKLDALPKAETKNSGSIEARTLASGILTPNSSVDYSVSLWMDENVTIEDGAMNKILKSKIVVISKALSQITSDDPITQSIIAQLDTTGKCPKVNADGTMQLTDAETGSGYLCSAPDNYGLSYYYRGDVTNNYVQFGKWPDDTPDVVYGYESPSEDSEKIPSYKAFSSMDECQKDSNYNNNCTIVSRKGKPMYWRILRVNGDGSYRLVYDGTEMYANQQISQDRQAFDSITTSSTSTTSNDSMDEIYQTILNTHDNAAAGYMHGDIEGLIEGTETEEVTVGSSDSVKLAKEYTFTNDKGFQLSNATTVTQKNLTQDYVGYYFFTVGDSYKDEENINLEIYQITSITTDGSDIKMTRKTITYGTKSKEQAQTNKNDSYYKLVMDAWYKSIFKDSIYEQYLADNIFCNDRTIDSDTFDGAYKNLGYGQENTLYRFGGAYYRGMQKLMQDYIDNNGSNPFLAIIYFFTSLDKITMDKASTSLICSQKNDSFTVSDSLYGNANLTYPIGELTADDVMTAGGYFGKTNENYFLHTGNAMGLITPMNYPFALSLSFSNSAYSPKTSSMLFTALANNGTLMGNNYGGFIMSNPVINLKNGTLNSGTGSREDPYLISDAVETTKVKKEYYLNNKKVDVIPQTYEKNRYSIDKIECDNGATGTWNTDKWTLETSNVTTTSTCKIYFTYEQKLKTKYYVNEKSSNITAESAKVGNYTVDRVTCNNGVTGTWNNDKWELEVTNFDIDATCNVYLNAPTISIANNKIEVDSYGICPNTKLDGNTTISTTETNKGYVCGALDTYGVSYYYRGNVTNNYVKFGKWADNTPDTVIGYYSDSSSNYKEYSSMSECNNASQYKTNCTTVSRAGKDMYWRILRINGDGTIRMMYDGTSAHDNEDKSIDREIGKSQFNSVYGDNAYIGYMYGTVGSSTYAATHTNTNNSTIKTYLDNWYRNNIAGTSNEQYITDKVFCNDRSFSSDNTGTGAGTNSTKYRWYSGSSNSGSLLTCPQQNDAFTVSDTSTGNGKLTYPIGLITADEASLAGAYGSGGFVPNKKNYLYSSNEFWTMTPSSYNSTNLVQDGYWFITHDQTYSDGVRPVINLKADALKVGAGTADDPYRIS